MMIQTTARAVSGLALAAALAGAGCTTDPRTGQTTVDAVAVFELLTLAGGLVKVLADDDPAPDVWALATNGVEEGIARFCRLDPWDQDTVRRQLDARDPSLRPYLIARYGGADGNVCTEDGADDRP